MKLTCTRRLEFDAAHRVMNHESKCATLHGHRYVVEVSAQAEGLDAVGRIIDFSVLKEKIGTWLDKFWDHTSIIYEKDRKTIEALMAIPQNKGIFVSKWNPTAENMAQWLVTEKIPELLQGTGVLVTRVRVYETPNCYSDAWI